MMKRFGLKEIFSLSDVNISFLISIGTSKGFSILIIFEIVSLTIEVSSIFGMISGG